MSLCMMYINIFNKIPNISIRKTILHQGNRKGDIRVVLENCLKGFLPRKRLFNLSSDSITFLSSIDNAVGSEKEI